MPLASTQDAPAPGPVGDGARGESLLREAVDELRAIRVALERRADLRETTERRDV